MSIKSFEGIVEVYNEEFYVNTETGAGLDSVLKKIDPLLCKMASKVYLPGYSFDDIKQELVIIAIDGIMSYSPDKNTKLSTFLHLHIRNKLISKLRSENKMSNDAFGLHSEESDETFGKIKRAREELSFSQCTSDDDKRMLFENTVSNDDSVYRNILSNFNDVDFKVSIEKLTETLDETTAKIIRLIYFDDYSIKAAADEVGLTGWAASKRLKNLADKKTFIEVFGVKDLK